MVQIFGGLISYLVIAIYCHEEFNEKISIERIQQLRTKILNELFQSKDSSGPEKAKSGKSIKKQMLQKPNRTSLNFFIKKP